MRAKGKRVGGKRGGGNSGGGKEGRAKEGMGTGRENKVDKERERERDACEVEGMRSKGKLV